MSADQEKRDKGFVVGQNIMPAGLHGGSVRVETRVVFDYGMSRVVERIGTPAVEQVVGRMLTEVYAAASLELDERLKS